MSDLPNIVRLTLEDLGGDAAPLENFIAQQQARIAELEKKLAYIEKGEQATIAHQRVKIDELTATVKRLNNKDIGSFLHELSSNYDGDWSYSSIEEFALIWEQGDE